VWREPDRLLLTASAAERDAAVLTDGVLTAERP
jgi:hypothetical protein